MMRPDQRRWLLLLPLLALPSLGPAACPSGGPGGIYVAQQQLGGGSTSPASQARTSASAEPC